MTEKGEEPWWSIDINLKIRVVGDGSQLVARRTFNGHFWSPNRPEKGYEI